MIRNPFVPLNSMINAVTNHEDTKFEGNSQQGGTIKKNYGAMIINKIIIFESSSQLAII